MAESKAIFNRLNEVQAIQQAWESKIIPEEERTPQSRLERMNEEVVELQEAVVRLDGTPERQLEVGYEAADVIIIALGVIDALGYDAERLIEEKMRIGFIKYNPLEVKRLRANGLSSSEALKVQKERRNSLNGRTV